MADVAIERFDPLPPFEDLVRFGGFPKSSSSFDSRSSIEFPSSSLEPSQDMGGELIWSPARAKGLDLDEFLAACKYSAVVASVDNVQLCSMETVLHLLHSLHYDAPATLQYLQKHQLFWTVGFLEGYWSTSDIETLAAGLSSAKKYSRMNKFRFIQMNYLQNKTIPEIISFYYSHYKIQLAPRYSSGKGDWETPLQQKEDSPAGDWSLLDPSFHEEDQYWLPPIDTHSNQACLLNDWAVLVPLDTSSFRAPDQFWQEDLQIDEVFSNVKLT